MVRNASTDPCVAVSGSRKNVNVRPKTIIAADTTISRRRRPTASPSLPDNGTATMNAKMEINCSRRNSVYGMPRPRPRTRRPMPKDSTHVVTR